MIREAPRHEEGGIEWIMMADTLVHQKDLRGGLAIVWIKALANQREIASQTDHMSQHEVVKCRTENTETQ